MLSDYLDKIINGDCLEVMRELPDGCVDAVITDPPYGIDYQSAWRIDPNEWKPKIANDKKPFIWWAFDAFRVTKDKGCVFCFCRWNVQEPFRMALESAGFDIKAQVIWDRRAHGMGDLEGNFAPQHDVCWFGTKGRFTFYGDRPKSIIGVQRMGGEELIHPNQKPVELIKGLVETLTPLGGCVLDPFLGSGTTAVACKETGRHYIGIELEEKYCEIARRRVAEATPSLFAKEAVTI